MGEENMTDINNESKNGNSPGKRDPRALLVNTIMGLVITCIVLTVITLISLGLAISAKMDVKKVYTYTGSSIIEEGESEFYFDGTNFVENK